MNSLPDHSKLPAVRLWSFQRAAVVAVVRSSGVYRADWADAPKNWRMAYEWMADQMVEATNHKSADAPIWCWHSCNGKIGSPPTVGTATALFGSVESVQGMVTLELAVPSEFVLLSSYHEWNAFLDYVIVEKRLPNTRRKYRKMFAEPLLKHDADEIQAVIPFIDSAWVRGVSELTVAGRNWEFPLLPALPLP
jgi:hypothetical protein